MKARMVASRSVAAARGLPPGRDDVARGAAQGGAGLVGVGQRAEPLEGQHAVQAVPRVEEPAGARSHVPGELPGHRSGRDARNLPGGQAAGGDAEVAQDGVELADRALVPGQVQGLRPGAGGGAGGVGECLGGCGGRLRLRQGREMDACWS